MGTMKKLIEISSEEMSKLVNEKGKLDNSCRYINIHKSDAIKKFELDYCQKLSYYTIYYCLITDGVEFFVDNHFDYKDVLSRIEKLEKSVESLIDVIYTECS